MVNKIIEKMSKCADGQKPKQQKQESTVQKIGETIKDDAPCMGLQIGAWEGTKYAMKKASAYQMKKVLRKEMEDGTLEVSEKVAQKMAKKFGTDYAEKMATEEVGERVVAMEASEAAGPVGWALDGLMAAGMLMDMENPEGFTKGVPDEKIENMIGSLVVKGTTSVMTQAKNIYKQLDKSSMQAKCLKDQIDNNMMLASPIGTGIEREHNVQTTHDYAINLNDPIIRRKVRNYMLDYLKYTGPGIKDEPPIDPKTGAPDENKWEIRQFNSKGETLKKDFLKPDTKAHKKYTRTKKQLNFEDKYAKPMFQAGVKHNNENLKVISGNMQDHPSIWASASTLVIGLLIWMMLRFLPVNLKYVNVFSTFALGSALLYIKFEKLDTTPILDYILALVLYGIGIYNLM